MVPDLETFLGGRPGHTYVQLPFPTTRLATFVEDRANGTIVVNHGTVNWRFQAQPGVAPDWHDADPVASLPVLVGEHRDTRVTLPNGWGPVAADFGARLTVYDPSGLVVADVTREVPVDTLVEISMRELLGAVPGSDFVGHAEVRLVPRGIPDERPALFEVLVAIVDDDRMLAEVQVGGGFFNSDAPADAAFPAIPRTRVFSRVRIDEPATTWVYLAHPRSGADAGAPAAPRLTLLDADGQRSVIRDLEIAPHGCVFSDVRDLFPEWSTVLGPSGRGTLRVRDVTARLYGYSITGDAGAPTVAIDHLIGG